MKVSTLSSTQNSPLKRVNKLSQKPKEVFATGTGVDVRLNTRPDSVIKENRPDDPIVSKKILDSLDLGFLNFSQKERDTLAKIMNKANS